MGDDTQTMSFDDIDQETIAIAPSATTPETEGEDTQPVAMIDDSKAQRYGFFAANKMALSSGQIQAITNKTPILSIIINPLGQQRAMTDKAVKTLPNDITIGLSSHIPETSNNIQQFRDYGFELWMTLSAITLDMNHDKGALALTPTRDFEYNINLLADQIGNKDFFTGLILPPQALIKKSGKMWEDIVYDVFGQGYGLLDNNIGIIKPSFYFYDDFRAPYLQSDLAMDSVMSLNALEDLLKKVRQDVVTEGRYIVSLPSLTPAHLDILVQWVDSLPQDNITLVPLSAQAQL